LVKEKSDFKRVKITCSRDAAEYAHNFYGFDIELFESFFIMLLNNSNNTIGYVKISQGGIVGTIVDVRIVAKYAVESLSTGIILVHNHPSGNLKPSQPDIDLTKKIKEGLKILDVTVLDHIIIIPIEKNENIKYTSLCDDGLM
jgi:DNA repair protein RadC